MAILNRMPKKIIVIIVVCILFYAAVGFLGVPFLAQKYLPEKASELLDRQVSMVSFSFNPFLFSTKIKGLEIKTRDEATCFFSVEQLDAGLSLESIVKLAPVISKIQLDRPKVNIVRQKDGTLNCFYFKRSSDAEKEDTAEKADPAIPEFIVKNASIQNGSIRFEDKRQSTVHQMTELSFFLPYLSSRSDKIDEKAGMDLHFVLNQTRVDVNVQATPFASEPSVQALVKTSDVDLTHYLSYVPVPENITIKSLGINTDLQVLLAKKNKEMSFELQGRVNLVNLDLVDQSDASVVKFSTLALEWLPSNILENDFRLGKAVLTRPQINIHNDESGSLNLATLLTTEKSGDLEDTSSEAVPVKEEADAPGQTSGFRLTLNRLDIGDATIDVKDLAHQTPFETRISPLTASFENVVIGESVSGAYAITFETEAKEKFDSSGQFNVNPLSAAGSLKLTDINLKKYAPFLEHMGVMIENGKVTANADFDIQQIQDQLQGEVKLSTFLLDELEILDRQLKEKMVHLPVLTIADSRVNLTDRFLDTGSIKLGKGFVDIRRGKNGQINILDAFGNFPAGDGNKASDDSGSKLTSVRAADQKPPAAWHMLMPVLDVTDFKVHFEDHTNTDPVVIDLSPIVIKVSDLWTSGDKKANITIQSGWNQTGKIDITGMAFPPAMQADLGVKLKGIDIKSVQPYFTDFVKVLVTDGHIQTQGKLTLDLGKKRKPEYSV